jgi:hypothetical protein
MMARKDSLRVSCHILMAMKRIARLGSSLDGGYEVLGGRDMKLVTGGRGIVLPICVFLTASSKPVVK